LGDEHFGDTVERTIGNQTIRGRRLIVRRGKDATDFKTSHILFISETEKERLPQIIESLQGANVLTVSESEHFCQLGGMINFKQIDKQLSFEINPRAAERANLKISSQLLKLSIITRQAGKEDED
jgi:hypothetical protein